MPWIAAVVVGLPCAVLALITIALLIRPGCSPNLAAALEAAAVPFKVLVSWRQ